MKSQPLWEDLYNFIQDKVKKDPDFLKKKLYIECMSEDVAKRDYPIITDSEGWIYVQPIWFQVKDQKKAEVLSTYFIKEDIVTLNINY